MKKRILTEILFFLKNRQEALKKKLDCNFIRINPSKENYDADYEIGRIQKLISEFKNKKLKKSEEELKEKLNLYWQVKSFNKIKLVKMDCRKNIARL